MSEPILLVRDLYSGDPPDWPEVAHLADRGAYDDPWYATRVTPEGFRSVIGSAQCSVCGAPPAVPCLGSHGRWIHAGRTSPPIPQIPTPPLPVTVVQTAPVPVAATPRVQPSKTRPAHRPLEWHVARERALQRLGNGKA